MYSDLFHGPPLADKVSFHVLCAKSVSLKIEETSTAVFSLGLNSEATSREAEAWPSNLAIQWEVSLGKSKGELETPGYRASPSFGNSGFSPFWAWYPTDLWG